MLLAAGATVVGGPLSIGRPNVAEAATKTATSTRLNIKANDIIWDAKRDVLYASVDDASPTYANKVVTIDPESGAVLSSRSVGTDPNAMAITANGNSIYIGIDGRGDVQKFSLPGFTPGWSFTFGTYTSRQMLAGDIQVMPGTANTIAVSRRVDGLSPSLAGVEIIDSGVARTDTTPSHNGSNSLAFSADPAVLYGSDTESSGTYFQRLAIDDDGVTEQDENGMGGGDIIFHDGLVYGSNGKIVDPVGVSPSLDDTLPGGSGVAIDATANRLYYSVQRNVGTLTTEITSYNLNTRALLNTWKVPAHLKFSDSLISLGNKRLAYLDMDHPAHQAGYVMLVHLEEPPVEEPSLGAFGEFTALTPDRILDTRYGIGRGGNTAPVGDQRSITVQVTGEGGVPNSDVTAVVMNVTVTQPTAASYLTVHPTGVDLPTISNLNYVPGQTVPNLVTVAVGANGRVDAFNRSGTAHVIFDVVGYYADETGNAGSRFHGIDPFRYFDTRSGSPIGENASMTYNVLGKGGVPKSGVSAVVMNVTVTQPTKPSFLTVYPNDVSTMPTASNLNYGPNQTVPNLVVVRVPADGKIRLFNRYGSTHVIADVVGYYDNDRSTEAGRLIASVPERSYDTRDDGRSIGPSSLLSLQFVDGNEDPIQGFEALVLNVTVTSPTASSYLTVFPDDLCTPPMASNLNYDAGQTVPNHVIVRLSDTSGCASGESAIALFNRFGAVHAIVDVFGGFTSATFDIDLLLDDVDLVLNAD